MVKNVLCILNIRIEVLYKKDIILSKFNDYLKNYIFNFFRYFFLHKSMYVI